jgi:hypothetical protein
MEEPRLDPGTGGAVPEELFVGKSLDNELIYATNLQIGCVFPANLKIHRSFIKNSSPIHRLMFKWRRSRL